jgi:superoxide dismutase, Fe-Mn family
LQWIISKLLGLTAVAQLPKAPAQALHIARLRAVSLARVVSPIMSEASRGYVAAAKRGCVGHDDVQASAADSGDPNMRYQIAPLYCRPWTLNGITPKLIESHYENNYGGTFTRLNVISEELEAIDPATAPPHVIRRLKQDEAAALNSLALHELYFASLGGDGRAIPEGMANALARDFGSVDRWRSEFVALANSLDGGSGWVLLSWLPRAGRLVNQIVADGSPGVAGTITVLALDMYEHSYHLDFGTNTISYVATFMRNIDWSAVAGRYEDAVEVKPPRPLVQKQFGDLPSVTVDEVKAMLDSGTPVQIIDTRPRHYSSRAADIMHGAIWRDPERVDEWIGELSKSAPVVTFCVYGFHIGCETAVTLRKAGFDARYMAGGHFAWKAIKGPVKLFELTTPL